MRGGFLGPKITGMIRVDFNYFFALDSSEIIGLEFLVSVVLYFTFESKDP